MNHQNQEFDLSQTEFCRAVVTSVLRESRAVDFSINIVTAGVLIWGRAEMCVAAWFRNHDATSRPVSSVNLDVATGAAMDRLCRND